MAGRLLFVVRLVALLVVTAVGLPCALGAERLQYNRDVRPILFDACIACHGPDSASRTGRPAARPAGRGDRDGGDRAGRSRGERDDPADPVGRTTTERMPPPETKKTLTDAQKETLARWIARGGRVPAALVAHRADAAGAAGGEATRRGCGTPIDRFVAGAARSGGPRAGGGGRSADACPARESRSHRPAAVAGDAGRVRRRRVAGRLREVRRRAAGFAAVGASIAAGTGSTRRATPTRTASTSTTIARCGRTAIG